MADRSEPSSNGRRVELTAEVKVHLGNDLWLEKVAIADLKEQDVNAHVMSAAKMDQLASNIRRRGGMESVPYCAQPGGEGPIEVVSGHHRIRAARTAGLTEVVVLVDRAPYTRSQIIAKQLAHNALVGNDDADTVRVLLAQITSVDDLLETGLGDEYLPTADDYKMTLFTPHADFEWLFCTFTFLPHQVDKLKELIKEANVKTNIFVTGSEEQFEPFLKAVAAYAQKKEVLNAATAIALLTDVALSELARLERLEEKAKDKDQPSDAELKDAAETIWTEAET